MKLEKISLFYKIIQPRGKILNQIQADETLAKNKKKLNLSWDY